VKRQKDNSPAGAWGAECLWRIYVGWRAQQRRRRPGHQSSKDTMTALREQTLTQNAVAFSRQCPLHDTARSPGTAEPSEPYQCTMFSDTLL